MIFVAAATIFSEKLAAWKLFIPHMTKLIHPLLIHLKYIARTGDETNARNDTCKFPIKLNSLKQDFALINQKRIFIVNDAAISIIKIKLVIKIKFFSSIFKYF